MNVGSEDQRAASYLVSQLSPPYHLRLCPCPGEWGDGTNSTNRGTRGLWSLLPGPLRGRTLRREEGSKEKRRDASKVLAGATRVLEWRDET